MTLEQRTDYEDRDAQRVTQRFRGKPRIEGLVRSYAAQNQEIEDAAFALLTADDVDAATGTQLDVLGRVARQPREGRTDDEYRPWVKARIAVNRSSGTPPELLAIVQSLLPGITLRYIEHYPAAILIDVVDPIDINLGDQVARLIQDARLGGVRLLMKWSPALAVERFRYGPSGRATSTGYGFGRGYYSAISDGTRRMIRADDPRTILRSKLFIWWDPFDADTVVLTGGKISSVLDKSGNGWDALQVTDSLRPTYVGGYITFAAGQVMSSGAAFALGPGARPEMYVVGQYDDLETVGNQVMAALNNPVVTLGLANQLQSTDIWRFVSYHNGGVGTINTQIANDTALHLFSQDFRSTGAKVRIDGTAYDVGSSNALGATADELSIGGEMGDPPYRLNGKVGDVIVTDQETTDGERQALEAYLAEKHSITMAA